GPHGDTVASFVLNGAVLIRSASLDVTSSRRGFLDGRSAPPPYRRGPAGCGTVSHTSDSSGEVVAHATIFRRTTARFGLLADEEKSSFPNLLPQTRCSDLRFLESGPFCELPPSKKDITSGWETLSVQQHARKKRLRA